MRWRKNSKQRFEDTAIVREAQALLDGTVRTVSYPQWRRVPPWAYINQLAHADAGTLVRLAKDSATLPPTSWDSACAFLAGELLALASGGRELVEVQRALVPLELDLLDKIDPANLTPAMLVRRAFEALAAAGYGAPGN
jgi:hypothetical protein